MQSKTLSSLLMGSMITASIIFTGCTTDDDSSNSSGTTTVTTLDCDTLGYSAPSSLTLTGAIEACTELDAATEYTLSGLVVVTNGATLKIPAGTHLYGETDAYMIIDKKAKILANGTASSPVVFDSVTVQNDGAAGQGQWGGLTILGEAFVNQTGGTSTYEANTNYSFGGTSDTGNSGTLTYVQINNSGYTVGEDKEVNGLSLCGVGSGTTINNISVTNSGDDGIELWGGTVNLTDIAIDNAGDDSFDIDFGYKGTVTNLVITNVTKAGIEASSDGTPGTTATFNNVTMTLPSTASEGGIYLKDEDTAPTFLDVNITGTGTKGSIYVAEPLTNTALAALSFKNFAVINPSYTVVSKQTDSVDNLTTAQIDAIKARVTANDGVLNATEVVLAGNLSTMTLDATTEYVLRGLVVVPDGVTLTIPAGTKLYGESDAYMIVDQGGKIVANGTASSPVIFDSVTVQNGGTAGQGQWGGLTILGKATINQTGGTSAYEANTAFDFGGTSDTDNSGTLTYVQINNSGYTVGEDKEVNGLSLCGVGSGTTINNISVTNSGDDGIEVWGGTVNFTDITIDNAGDDSFDIDYGYSGTVTNLTITNVTKAGIEASSDGTPGTTATFDNVKMTLPDTASEGGIYLKDEDTAPTFKDVTITGTGTKGTIYVAEPLTATALTNLSFKNFATLNSGYTVVGKDSGVTTADIDEIKARVTADDAQ